MPSPFRHLDQLMRGRDERRAADAERFASLDNDACMACGAYGDDKRSLYIECFYDLTEAIPDMIDMRDVPGDRDGYYLRVCKACRGAFIGRLREWWQERVARRGLPMDHDGEDADPEPTHA